MIGVYARVSWDDQNVETQIDELRDWLRANGHDLESVAWYVDDGKSSQTLDRPQLKQLREDIFRGKIKTVVCWRLDRLSRRFRDGIVLLTDWVDRGVRVVVVTQQIDLSGVIGQAVAGVLIAFGQLEYESLKVRQRAGIARAKREGKYTGRKPGTQKARPERAHELRQRGLSISEISQAMGVSPRTVSRYLATK